MKVESLDVRVFEVPTDSPESDGTLEWTKTTMVAVEARSGKHVGLGWTYGHRSIATVVRDVLEPIARGRDPARVKETNLAMRRAVRNDGQTGIAAMAISAVDSALWDLHARTLGAPLAKLLGVARDEVELYGSGGFTSYDDAKLSGQLGGWARDGFRRVKMKIGRDPDRDPDRVRAARESIGRNTELFVDANGAFHAREAIAMAERLARFDVRWFEEPVSSDDIAGLAFVRANARIPVTTGEYGWRLDDFGKWLDVVDVLQADASRCGGITGFLEVAALCKARHLPLSSHCAPHLHLALGCALENVVHLEWFHDHVRIEEMLLCGAMPARDGRLHAALDRPGNGLEIDREHARRFEVSP